MSDMLAEGGPLQVDPASVDESLDEGHNTSPREHGIQHTEQEQCSKCRRCS